MTKPCKKVEGLHVQLQNKIGFLLTCTLLTNASAGKACGTDKTTMISIDDSSQVTRRIANRYTILATQFNESAPSESHMFAIERAGEYDLINDVQLAPKNTNVSGIKIMADNVTLNLDHRSISQKNTTQGFVAIEVASNMVNVIIKDGAINNIKGTGIKINEHCNTIQLKHVDINKCTNAGVLLNNITNARISNLNVTDCNGDSTSDAVGLKAQSCKNIIIEDSTFNNNRNLDGKNGYGVHLSSCTNCMFYNCNAFTNFGAIGAGFFADNTCLSCKFSNCKAEVNGSNTDTYGFHINGYGNTLTKCTSSNNQSTSDAHFVFGFSAAGGNCNQFLECIAQHNTGGNDSSAAGIGFMLAENERNSSIQQCKSEANTAGPSTGYGAGIMITNDSQYNYLDRNQLIGNGGPTNGYGIYDLNTTSNNCYTRNFAYGNGKLDGTAFNNYEVNPAPSGSLPVLVAQLRDYEVFDQYNGLDMYNIEIIRA
jgi:hypothetical protein